MPNTALVLDDNYARHFRALASITMDEFSVGIPGKITHPFNFFSQPEPRLSADCCGKPASYGFIARRPV